jgi:hypothetical protein
MKDSRSRRQFLRGAGVALALPWMESVTRAAATTAAASNQPPVRFACIYFSNGVDPVHWWQKGAGSAMEMGPAAAPLMPVREDLIFINGLYNHQAFINPSPHMGRMANMLSGAPVSADPSVIRVGTTFDQVLFTARTFRGPHRPSLLRKRSIPRVRSINWSAMARAANSTGAFSMRCFQTRRACKRKSARVIGASSTSIWNPFATSRSASIELRKKNASKGGVRR